MSLSQRLRAWTKNESLITWVEQAVTLCRPASVHLCDGSKEEFDQICNQLVDKEVFVRLNPKLRPSSFRCCSDPSDVARVEEATFICSRTKEDAGPTNNWRDPKEMKELLLSLFKGCMEGRTLYVVPFCMGPLGSKYSRIGVEITDSPYVACSMYIMTRMGNKALERLGNGDFVPCMHSVGYPLRPGNEDVKWPCSKEHKYIVHFPEEKQIWSYGSGYGGNALLGKKSFALRIASAAARHEGWLAEHMLILGITNPKGKKKYFAAAFPSACGKTNLAMLQPTIPGWKIECVGDDIAWMHFDKNGILRAINPEAGFFGVAPGTSERSNPNAMRTISHGTIFTNVAMTPDGDVWWEGMTETPPPNAIDWLGKPWTPTSGAPAAHPNARFTTPIYQCPIVDEYWEDPEGVPISAILFGGRRTTTVPLVYEALNWEHGVLIGAGLCSETTAAAKGEVGKLRHDPFAMLPFCGYNMADYFQHWLDFGKKHGASQLPRIFFVNWFRKDSQGKFIWPGFGENIRVLEWIFERVSGTGIAQESPIGWLPGKGALNTIGLKISEENLNELFQIDKNAWEGDLEGLRSYFQKFGDKAPQALYRQIDLLQSRLKI